MQCATYMCHKLISRPCGVQQDKKLHLSCFLNINTSNEIQAKHSYEYFYQLKCARYDIKVYVRR